MVLPIHLYGLLIGLGVVAAIEVAERIATKKEIEKNHIWQLAAWVVSGGVIGARIYHVIDYWSRWYSLHPIEVLYLWQGGLGIWGAIVGGILSLYGYYLFSKDRTNFRELLDCVIVGLPLAQAIGRLGNFFNREIYGSVTSLPWGIYIPETNQYHHPLFAYEAILDLGLFTILWRMSQNKKTEGRVSGVYLVGYGIIRAILENLRPTNIAWRIGGISTAIIFSLLAIVSGTYLIFYHRR